jgi:hypothetical protein
MVKTSEAIGRALVHNAVFHGCVTPQDMKDQLMPVATNTGSLHDPANRTDTYFCFQGTRFYATDNSVTVRLSGCSFEDFVMLLAQAAEDACMQNHAG